MAITAGPAKLVKAGFVQLDTRNPKPQIVVFQYNPETLVRRLEGTASPATGAASGVHGATAAGGGAAGAGAPVLAGPIETVSFTIPLDATDQLERGDPLTQQSGLLPMISALELLLYPSPGVLTVWVSGGRRVLPVRISEIVFNEQAFDAALNPIRAEIFVSLRVLKDAELANDSRGRALWDAHFATLQQLAKTVFDSGSMAALGLNGI